MTEQERRSRLRYLCRTDLYYLLRYALNRPDLEHPWLFDRCREVQQRPNGMLDLWAREHYKSTIITFALSVQDILKSHGDNPLVDIEARIGIFSCTRPLAKRFVSQIKFEFEENEFLNDLFPDILWKKNGGRPPKWSLDDGLIVRRKGNPTESTIEAWGVVEGQPTGKHFTHRVYDDFVTLDTVRSSESIAKANEALQLSDNLGTRGGILRFIGTKYHYYDPYQELVNNKTVELRTHPVTADGTVDGEPVFLTKKEVEEKRRRQGIYVFACQQLMKPTADGKMGFKREWLRYYDGKMTGENLNVYLIVDPANEKKKTSDYTSMGVIGLGADENYYLLDFYRDRLNLSERTKLLMDLHKIWKPLRVGYEKYGKDSDIQHIEEVMIWEKYRFPIFPLGGSTAKNDRIRWLVPAFEYGRFWLPRTQFKTNYEGQLVDLTEEFREQEYLPFPAGAHDDVFDMMARIKDPDMGATFPMLKDESNNQRGSFGGWMAC